MTVQEAADKLEVSRACVYALCRQRMIGHSRIGVGRGSIRISESDLAVFRESARAKAMIAPVRTSTEDAATNAMAGLILRHGFHQFPKLSPPAS